MPIHGYPYNCYRQQNIARVLLFYLAILKIRDYNAEKDARISNRK